MEKNVRLRILLVMEIILERTDEEHGVTMQDILEWLGVNGVAGERKSLYEDINALKTYGLAVEYYKEDKTYRLVQRQMELAELKLLVDAVHASKFITKSRTKQIIEDLMGYTSAYGQQALKREVYTEKPKSINSVGFYSMDAIHEAIALNCQIQFQYSAWNLKKKLELKHDGAFYQVSPWLMVWADENYYLVAYDGTEKKIKHFRVDKISNVSTLDLTREGKEAFDHEKVTNYSTSHFGMFGGEIKRVKLRVHNNLVGVVLDQFGTDVAIMPEGKDYFTVNVEVAVSNQFFAWVFGLGSQIQIVTPDVAEQMKAQLLETVNNYK